MSINYITSRGITWPTLGLILVLGGLCYAAYVPGISSGFLFDDAANLPILGEFGRINNAAAFFRFITAGHADPTGRPISLLSFLFDGRDWPTSPLPFKRTNLAIHFINGALLGTFLWRLGRAHGLAPRIARFAAWFTSAAWLLHPLFVSTVLYIVQREAMLPATFVLVGLHAWLTGRRRILEGQRFGTIALVAGVITCTTLAFLSKANGLLLPLLILIVEACTPILGDAQARERQYLRRLYWTTWPLAALVIVGVIVVALRSIGHGTVEGRDFSILQRLMTEPTILLDYLKLLWLLDPHYGSLFHDQYRPATGWLQPWTTLPAILLCATLCVIAWLQRRRWPALALAVLFFFAGHIMESSSLALELYFEHRNYLPSLMMFWPLGVALARPVARVIPMVTAVGVLLGLAAITWGTASLWGKPLDQARVWVAESPQSPRAQTYAAQIEASYGYARVATERLQRARTRFPDQPQIALALVDIRCTNHALDDSDWVAVDLALRTTTREPGSLLTQWATNAIDKASTGECQELTLDRVQALLDAAASNPRISRLPGRMQDIAHLRGVISLKKGDAASALTWFNEALRLEPKPAVALQQAALLGSAGHADEGLAHLRYFDTLEVPPVRPTQGMTWLHDRLLTWQRYWPGEIAHLRETLGRDAQGSGT